MSCKNTPSTAARFEDISHPCIEYILRRALDISRTFQPGRSLALSFNSNKSEAKPFPIAPGRCRHARGDVSLRSAHEFASNLSAQSLNQQVFTRFAQRKMKLSFLLRIAPLCLGNQDLAFHQLSQRFLLRQRARAAPVLLEFAEGHLLAADHRNDLSGRVGLAAGSEDPQDTKTYRRMPPKLAKRLARAHASHMQTIHDWLSMALFCLIALTFLQRSLHKPPFPDPMIRYIPPAAGCALANWLGNEGYGLPAIATLALAAGYYWHVLKPLRDLR